LPALMFLSQILSEEASGMEDVGRLGQKNFLTCQRARIDFGIE